MKKIRVFLISLLIVFAVNLAGSLFTFGNTNSEWYISNRPDFTPPSSVFSIVWPILYILIAISLYLVWIKSKKKDRIKIKLAYGTNLILNALWSYLFFGLQNPLAGFIDIILIWISIWAMIFAAYKIDRRASWLLVPYLLWVTFAAFLNLGFLI